MWDEGSTGITATLLLFFISFMPRFSIKVDLPAPEETRGEGEMNKQERKCEERERDKEKG